MTDRRAKTLPRLRRWGALRRRATALLVMSVSRKRLRTQRKTMTQVSSVRTERGRLPSNSSSRLLVEQGSIPTLAGSSIAERPIGRMSGGIGGKAWTAIYYDASWLGSTPPVYRDDHGMPCDRDSDEVDDLIVTPRVAYRCRLEADVSGNGLTVLRRCVFPVIQTDLPF